MLVDQKFDLIEATIADVHAALQRCELTARELVELYLARIEAYDQKGPAINSLVSINSRAREEASALDAAFKRDGRFVGPLHGIPIIVKDQINVKGMKTTLGSVLFRRDGRLRRRQAARRRRDLSRQINLGRAWRRRHARLAVRLDAQCL